MPRKYCSTACRDACPEFAARLIKMIADQQAGNTNANERRGYRLLGELGVIFLPQHTIAGKFCVDAFVPHANLVVQFDGDYWHSNPALFPDPDARQARRAQLDRSQDAYLTKCGYRVLRLWDSEMKANPGHARAQLLAAIIPPKQRRVARV